MYGQESLDQPVIFLHDRELRELHELHDHNVLSTIQLPIFDHMNATRLAEIA